MLFYLLVIVTSTFAAYLYQRVSTDRASGLLLEGGQAKPILISHAKIFLFISFLILFLTSALRVDVGSDYRSYRSWFVTIAAGYESYFEPLFYSLVVLISSFTTNPQWLIATSSFITLVLTYVAIRRHSVNPALSVFLFSAMSFYFASFNGIRQFIAISIILLLFDYLAKRKVIKYLLGVIVASMFHTSALIMIPVYFLVGMRYKPLAYIIVIAIASSSFLFRDALLGWMIELYPMYAGNDAFLYRGFSFSEVLIATGLVLAVVMLVFFKRGKMSMANTTDRVIFNITFYSLILHTCLAWIPAINRLTLYVDIAFILIIPLVLLKISNKEWRRFFTASLMIIYILYLSVSVGINNSHDVLPYTSVFDESIPRGAE